MTDLPPILVAGLFRELHGHLVDLLTALTPEEWHRPTASSTRTVKDIAAHLLDGSVRRLSVQRDGYVAPGSPSQFDSFADLVAYLARLNDAWTSATRRVSPRLLIGWIDSTGQELADLFASLDPFAPALYPVAWAGEESSANWFDVAREYTEKWHHTQQIFEATARCSTIIPRPLFHPCLDTFLRALPFTYRAVPAADGTTVLVTIHGDAGGDWLLQRHAGHWRLVVTGDPRSSTEPALPAAHAPSPPTAHVCLTQDSAWQLFTKRLDRSTALSRFPDITLAGDQRLGMHVLDLVAVMG